MTAVRLHPLHFTKYIQYGFVLCVFPVLRALLVFDIAAAWLAFTQSLLILLAVLLLSWLVWNRSEVCCEAEMFSVLHGLLLHRTDSYRREMISAVVVTRSLIHRLFGAARLTLYFKSEKPIASVTLVLKRRDAERFAHALIPAEQTSGFFEPAGFDRLIFVMLSANIIATSVLSVMTVYRGSKLLGSDFELAAKTGLERAAHLFSAWLPAGASALFTLVLFFTLLSLLRGLLSTSGFTVARSGNVLLCHGGLITKTERRILLSCVNSSSMHITPWARLVRRYPVYITAGGFRGHELPLIAVKKGQEKTILRLLPEFCLPKKPLCNPRRKRIGSYVWKTATLSGSLLALCIVSGYALPALTPILAALFVLSLGMLASSIEGFFREGICKNENRTFTLSYNRNFSRYLVSLYTNDLFFELKMHPVAASEGRCDFKVGTPSHTTYRLRGLEYSEVNRLKFNI